MNFMIMLLIILLTRMKKLKEKSKTIDDDFDANGNLECVVSCYESLLRQLDENCSPRYAWPELICDAIPLFEGEYVNFSISPTRVGNEEEETMRRIKTLGKTDSRISRLRRLIFAIFEKLETSASPRSAVNINVDESTSSAVVATLSPSIKGAIEVEKIASKDPNSFEDSAVSTARVALVRLMARF